MINYTDKIQNIVEEALTKKTFSLEIVNKIKELKDGFEKSQKEIEYLKERKEELEKDLSRLKGENEKLNEFLKKAKEIKAQAKKNEKIRYELAFQTKRAEEIKELFNVVFRNPVILRSQVRGHPYKDNSGYQQIATINDSEKEEIA